jgi:hypothetical protein
VCNNGNIRLQDGLISSEFGRVEVCFNGQWGVVCNHNHFFDEPDAVVACRQLGIAGVLICGSEGFASSDVCMVCAYRQQLCRTAGGIRTVWL